MVRALLTCSDEACPARFEAHGPPHEIAALACDCGCALEPMGWPDALPEGRPAWRLDLEPIGI